MSYKLNGLHYLNRGIIHPRMINDEITIDDFTSGIKHIKKIKLKIFLICFFIVKTGIPK
jgi:hypothetical protein